ncbi:hypothetical protein FNW25_16495, partial [Flavobacterium franklandianum]
MKNLLINISKVTNTVLKKHSINDALDLYLSDIAKEQQIDSYTIYKNKTKNGIITFHSVNKRPDNEINNPNQNDHNYDNFSELYEILSKNKSLHGL